MSKKFKYTFAGQLLSILSAHFKTAILFSVLWVVTLALWTSRVGSYIFAAIGAFAYFMSVYNTAWSVAKDDKKPYSPQEPRLSKGFMLTAFLAAANILFVVLYMLSWRFFGDGENLTSAAGVVGNIISMIWFSMYEAFLGMSKGHFGAIGYIIIFLLPFAAAALGHTAGYYGFDIYDKLGGLVYEKKKKN